MVISGHLLRVIRCHLLSLMVIHCHYLNIEHCLLKIERYQSANLPANMFPDKI